MWIFGYGSLIWRAGFDFERREPASIRGWDRRFWQASADHRGVPDAPGRVVTLVPGDGRVWGMGYLLDPTQTVAVMAQLDFREKGGYGRRRVPIYDRQGETLSEDATVYIGDPSDPCHVGEASLDDIAAVIATAEGPSGHNVEYLLRLAASLKAMQLTDPHVEELVARVESLASPTLRARFPDLFGALKRPDSTSDSGTVSRRTTGPETP